MYLFRHSRLLALSSLLLFSIGIGYALSGGSPFSNHPKLKQLQTKMEQQQEQRGQELVYLQCDRPIYQPGEDLWFSVYLRHPSDLSPSTISEVVYVELLNGKGQVLDKKRYTLENGQTAGDFQLPASLSGGYYKLKAYTQWQKNSQQFYEREIQVQKPVLPRLNMRLRFQEKSYALGQQVNAELQLQQLNKQPLANQAFSYQLLINGRKVKEGQGKTNGMGQALVQAQLPKEESTQQALINIFFPFEGQQEAIARPIPLQMGEVDLQFFAEGGDLLPDFRQTLAFKAIDEKGQAVKVSGQIFNAEGQYLQDFSSYHAGMGSLFFQPKAGERYYAKVLSPKVKKDSFALPQVQGNKSIGLRLRSQNSQFLDLDILSTKEQPAFLVLHQQQQPYYSKDLKLTVGASPLQIPIADLPMGLVQLTLFDAEMQPIAERLVFANAEKRLQVQIQTPKEKYLPRELVELDIRVTDHLGKAVNGQFALSVVDESLLSFADDEEPHILASLLLSSQLKGKIASPNFYFDEADDLEREKPHIHRPTALDQLLLTQGWRNFDWEQLKQAPNYAYLAEKARFWGKIIDTQGQGIPNIELQIDGKSFSTNEAGEYNIFWPNYKGKVVAQLTNKGFLDQQIHFSIYGQQGANIYYRQILLSGKVQQEEKPSRHFKKGKLQFYGRGRYLGEAKINKKGEYQISISEKVSEARLVQGAISLPTKRVQLEGKGENRRANFQFSKKALVERKKEIAIAKLQLARRSKRAQVRQLEAPQFDDAVLELEGDLNGIMDGVGVPPPPPPPPPPAPAMVPNEAKMEEPAVEEDEKAQAEVIELVAKDRLMDKPMPKPMPRREMERKKEVLRQVVMQIDRARTFYAPAYTAEQAMPDKRTDFRKTLYWEPLIQLKNGRAKLSFYCSDAITQFKVMVEGCGQTGGVGRQDSRFFVQTPLSVSAKLPAQVLKQDRLEIPVSIANRSSQVQKVQLSLDLPEGISLLTDLEPMIELAPAKAITKFVAIKIGQEAQSGKLVLALKGEAFNDAMEQDIVILDKGFPVRSVYAGQALKNRMQLHLEKPVAGSIRAQFKVYPNSLDQVMDGIASMMRMPSGCFEQTSSSNYPNLLALNYLRSSNQSRPALEAQAKQYLEVGYGRLTGYESPSGGFDWWGRDPGHEALTAYGLMQFIDMQAVFDVDPALIARTQKWLLSRRDGQGGWKKNPNHLHSWASSEITDAYIVWALAEAGLGQEIEKELTASYKQAVKSEDPYLTALVANALWAAKDKRGKSLLPFLRAAQQKDGAYKGAKCSVVNSTGQALLAETTALTAIALMRYDGLTAQVTKAIDFLPNCKNYYGYGSTQGTVLALKAILAYTELNKRAAESGRILVYKDGKKLFSQEFVAGQKEITLPDLTPYLSAGKQNIELRYEGCKQALPFELELAYNTSLPQNSAASVLRLKTQLLQKEIRMGEQASLAVQMKAEGQQNQPVVMAMIGIPAGLSPQLKQLKALQEQGHFEHFELFEDFVVLHLDQLQAQEERSFQLALKADIPGSYESSASSVFRYYTQEERQWAAPLAINILP